MSTRATYRIHDSYCDIDVTYYKHENNYPSGAAEFFKRMVEYKEKIDMCPSMGYASAFFRANLSVRPTESHEYHYDTEYRYDYLNSEQGEMILTVYEIDYEIGKKFGEYDWKLYFQGSLDDFIKAEEEVN